MPAEFAAFFVEIKPAIAGKNKTDNYQLLYEFISPYTSLDNSQEK